MLTQKVIRKQQIQKIIDMSFTMVRGCYKNKKSIKT